MISAEMITIIATACSGLFLGGVAWRGLQADIAASQADLKNQREQLDKKIDDHIADDERVENSLTDQTRRLWAYKDAHEKEAAQHRLEFQSQLAEVKQTVAVQGSQHQELKNMITSMQEAVMKKIDQLETRLEKGDLKQ